MSQSCELPFRRDGRKLNHCCHRWEGRERTATTTTTTERLVVGLASLRFAGSWPPFLSVPSVRLSFLEDTRLLWETLQGWRAIYGIEFHKSHAGSDGLGQGVLGGL